MTEKNLEELERIKYYAKGKDNARIVSLVNTILDSLHNCEGTSLDASEVDVVGLLILDRYINDRWIKQLRIANDILRGIVNSYEQAITKTSSILDGMVA